MRTAGSARDKTWPVIRGAAIELIHKLGFEKMNVRLLASEVGIQAGSLYNYFKSKEDLLSRIVCEIMEDLLLQITERLEACDKPVDRLCTFIDVMVLWHTAHRKDAFVAHMEVRSVSPERYDEYVGLRDRFVAILKDILSTGVAAGEFEVDDLDVTCLSTLSMLAAIPNWYRENGRLTGPELAAWYVQAVLKLVNAPGKAKKEPPAAKRKSVRAAA